MNARCWIAIGAVPIVTLLLTGGCGEAFFNQTASLGGAAAGARGSVQVVFINNTPHRAVFTVGSYDQTDPRFEPDYQQFSHRESGGRIDGDSTSEILSIDCARVFSIGGSSLLHLIDENLAGTTIDDDALVEGVAFFDVPSGDDEANDDSDQPVLVGVAPAFEALLGVDFPCNALLIIRFESDSVGPDPFRIDFELIPSESTR